MPEFRAVPPKGKEWQQIHLKLDADTYAILKAAAERDGVSMTQWLAQAIVYLNTPEKQ